MLKINQHTTTLSKALLTAGLLGGAAVATLGAGSAQAAFTATPGGYVCTFGGLGGCAVNDITGIVGGDKKLELLDWGLANGTSAIGNQAGIADGSTLEFTYQQPDSHPWHVDLNLLGNDTDGGFLKYKLDIIGSNTFSSAALMGSLQSNNPSVTKQIFSDSTFSAGAKICDITIGPSANQTCNISGQQIWVQDTWVSGQGVDNFSNDFQQVPVPAPLPLLGVGAALGSIRKLRKFSSQLKTFSMN